MLFFYKTSILLFLAILSILLLVIFALPGEPTKALVEEKRVDETETPTKSVSSSEKDLPDTTNAKAIKPSKKGNVVDLTVFMEAQCPDTTGFIKRRVNVTVVPFGKRIVLGKNKTTSHVSATWCGRV
uniref:Uncharacterized protein n=1 Tax=Ditylenchus dipsaci TaxID=166011 RepID=A0A915DDR6_9BILA